jgi:hypothetical protein
MNLNMVRLIRKSSFSERKYMVNSIVFICNVQLNNFLIQHIFNKTNIMTDFTMAQAVTKCRGFSPRRLCFNPRAISSGKSCIMTDIVQYLADHHFTSPTP